MYIITYDIEIATAYAVIKIENKMNYFSYVNIYTITQKCYTLYKYDVFIDIFSSI